MNPLWPAMAQVVPLLNKAFRQSLLRTIVDCESYCRYACVNSQWPSCFLALQRRFVVQEVLNGVGADGVGVEFPMLPVNCSYLPLVLG